MITVENSEKAVDQFFGGRSHRVGTVETLHVLLDKKHSHNRKKHEKTQQHDAETHRT